MVEREKKKERYRTIIDLFARGVSKNFQIRISFSGSRPGVRPQHHLISPLSLNP